jgi:ribosome-associated protein
MNFGSNEKIIQQILNGILEKKGFDIVIMDLRGLLGSIANYFIICSGNSDTQTKAIADSIEETVKKNLGEKVWHSEGKAKGEWILLDYIDVIVHIFLPNSREFYKLEDLWGDAKMIKMN